MAALLRFPNKDNGRLSACAKVPWINRCSIRQDKRVLVFSASRHSKVAMRLITKSQTTAHNKVSSACCGERAATWPEVCGSGFLTGGLGGGAVTFLVWPCLPWVARRALAPCLLPSESLPPGI